MKPNRNITYAAKNVKYCIICPNCKESYIGQCKIIRKRMNLHRDHSNPISNSKSPLKVNRHLKKCSGGYFHVYPFFLVPTSHQIARESYETYFQEKFKPKLHWATKYHVPIATLVSPRAKQRTVQISYSERGPTGRIPIGTLPNILGFLWIEIEKKSGALIFKRSIYMKVCLSKLLWMERMGKCWSNFVALAGVRQVFHPRGNSSR